MSLNAPHHALQRGASLIIVLVIITSMLLLLRAVVSVVQSQSEQIAVEYYGATTLALANSGLERGLATLFPYNNTVSPGCAAVPATPMFSDSRFTDCTVQLTCTAITGLTDTTGNLTVFRLVSQAQCKHNPDGSAAFSNRNWTTSREVSVEAKYVQ